MAEINIRPSGQVGPARVPHQVRTLVINVEMLPEGVRVSTPTARGWAAVAKDHQSLGRAVTAAFTEAQVAAYAHAHGQVYDLDVLTAAVPGDPMAPARARTRKRPVGESSTGWSGGQRRPDTHDPADWACTETGDWVSPAGRTYRKGTMMANQVEARRRRAGLPGSATS